MSIEERIEYPETRAMRELDQGLSAACTAAARAHLQLSSLHLARKRELQGNKAWARPPFIMA